MAKSKATAKKSKKSAEGVNIAEIEKLPPVIVTKKVHKKKNKKKENQNKRVKGKSELDNPKFANMGFMLDMVSKASEKEEKRQADKLARRNAIEQKLKEKEDKKEKQKDEKKAKLEKAKQAVSKKRKNKESQKEEKPAKQPNNKAKKRVRFAD